MKCKGCHTEFKVSKASQKYFYCPKCNTIIVDEEIEKALLDNKVEVSEESIEDILKQEKKLMELSVKNLKEAGKYIPFLIKVLKAGSIGLSLKATAFGALSYLLSPIDLIPDFIPVIGYLDDIAVVVFAVTLLLGSADVKKIYDEVFNEKQAIKKGQIILYYFKKELSSINYDIDAHENTIVWYINYKESDQHNLKGYSDKILKPEVLYVSHPFFKDVIIPYEEYDVILINERMQEDFRIFEALGAKKIDYKYDDYHYNGKKMKLYATIDEELVKAVGDNVIPDNMSVSVDSMLSSLNVNRVQDKQYCEYQGPYKINKQVFNEIIWYFLDEINKININDFFARNKKIYNKRLTYSMSKIYDGKFEIDLGGMSKIGIKPKKSNVVKRNVSMEVEFFDRPVTSPEDEELIAAEVKEILINRLEVVKEMIG